MPIFIVSMTKTELTEIIRKIVSEEVKNQFPHLINEILGKKSSPVQEVRQPVQPKFNIPKTGNPELDKVLEQTAPRVATRQPVHTGQRPSIPPVSLEGGGFSMSSFQAPETSYYDAEPIMESVDEMPAEELPDFLNKNFSTALKSSIKASAMRKGINTPL